jgi:hypothetical protein
MLQREKQFFPGLARWSRYNPTAWRKTEVHMMESLPPPGKPGNLGAYSIGSGWAASVFVWSVWAIMFLAALAFAWRYRFTLPAPDDLYQIVPVILGDQPVTLSWLWEQTGEHRIPLGKLLCVFFAKFFGFQSGAFFNVFALGMLSAAMVWAVRRLRGSTSYTDAFFPIALLNWGHAELFLLGQCVFFILVAVFTALVFLAIVKSSNLTLGRVMGVGSCLLLLPLCNAAGTAYVPALALWLAYSAILRWRSPDAHSKRNGLVMLTLAALAILVLGLYFRGLELGSQKPYSSSIRTTLRGSVQLLTAGFGPALHTVWRFYALALLGLLFVSVGLLLVVWFKRPQERFRAPGLLLFLAAEVSLALGLGYGRGASYDLLETSHYVILALPTLYCIYFIWLIYSPIVIGGFVQMCLFVAMCLPFLLDLQAGMGVAAYWRGIREPLERDIAAGLPSVALAWRHGVTLYCAYPEFELPEELKNKWAETLRKLRDAGIPPFQRMRADPSYRELSIPVVPAARGRSQAAGGSGCGSDDQPDLVFTLPPRPQFVYAVILSYSCEHTALPAHVRVFWENSGFNDLSDKERNFDLELEGRPGEQTAMIWVNDKIDQFCIHSQTKDLALKISKIKLLVPLTEDGDK